jgi:hypothetical protein
MKVDPRMRDMLEKRQSQAVAVRKAKDSTYDANMFQVSNACVCVCNCFNLYDA